MIWIGTDDGYIQLTGTMARLAERDAAALTSWSRVVMMDASHFT